MNRCVSWVLFVALFCLAVPAWAQQVDRASLTGTVTDSSGAVIPGVSVTATNTETRVVTSATTNQAGIYRILDLPIGRYNLQLRKEGFSAVEQSDIMLTIGQVAEIDVKMNVGAVSQTVTVKSSAPILETETNETGTTMSLNAYESLPLSISGGRDITAFGVATVPTVESSGWSTSTAGTQQFTTQALIDGTLAISSTTGTFQQPSMESVQEFRVDTAGASGAAAMYTSAGSYLFTLKSGTNQFHGSAVLFAQNEALNANTWMNDYNANTDPSQAWLFKKGRDRIWDYTFSGGGPVILPHLYNGRDKTFFYATWEQNRFSDWNFGAQSLTVPTADFLQGNFSALMLPNSPILDANNNPIYVQDTNGNTVQLVRGMIFDPASPNQAQGIGQVFAGNVIPSTRISKVSQQIAGYYQQYYAPMGSGLINNAASPETTSPFEHVNQFTLKMDHVFSPKDRLSGSFYTDTTPEILLANGGLYNISAPEGGPFSSYSTRPNTAPTVRLSESHNFRGSVLNVVGLTFQRYDDTQTCGAENWTEKLGQGNWGADSCFPLTSFGSAVNGIGESSIGSSNAWGPSIYNNYALNDTLTWAKGRHTLSFGGQLLGLIGDEGFGGGAMEITFSNAQTGAPTQTFSPYVGFGFASMLLGDVSSSYIYESQMFYGRRKTANLFATDSFKFNNRLTLNYGLNWNLNLPFHEKYGREANFDTSYKNPTTGVPGDVVYLSNGSQTFEGPTHLSDFAPHLGLAYKATKRVVARAAYSLYDVPYGMNFWGGTPYSFTGGAYYPTNQVLAHPDFTPAYDWDNGYPGVTVPGTENPNYLSWEMVNVSPNSLETGIVNQVNAGVEIELDRNTRLSLGYIGTRGTHLHDTELANNDPNLSAYSSVLQAGTEWDTVSNASQATAAGVPYPYQGYSGYAFAALAPFPQIATNFDDLFIVGPPLGKSEYNAFVAEATHRYSGGLSMNMSYTLASQRYTTNTANQVTWNNYTMLQNTQNLSYAANYIQPYTQSIVKGYVVYTLPFGKGRKFLSNPSGLVNEVVGGWTLAPLLAYYTGTPLTIDSSNGYPGLYTSTYCNVAKGADLSRHFSDSHFDLANLADPVNRYFNPAGFSNPAYGSFGTGGPWISGLNGFGYANENVAAYKDFRIREEMKLQFRMEFYNAFNRKSFCNPDSGISDVYFGQVTCVGGGGRTGQAVARFEW